MIKRMAFFDVWVYSVDSTRTYVTDRAEKTFEVNVDVVFF